MAAAEAERQRLLQLCRMREAAVGRQEAVREGLVRPDNASEIRRNRRRWG